MPRQRKHSVFRGACIQQTHQDTLALPDANRFTIPQHAIVDRGVFVANVGATRERHIGRRGAHRLHHGHKRRLPVVNREVHLHIVVGQLLIALDEQEAELPRVGPLRQIAVRACVGVIPARARRFRRERVAMRLAGCDHRRSLFHRAVVQRIDGQPMPVHDVGIGTGVGHVDGDRNTFAQAQHRARHPAVVGDRFYRDSLDRSQDCTARSAGCDRLSQPDVPERAVCLPRD